MATGAQDIFNSGLTLNSGVIDANFDGGAINIGHAANGGSLVVDGTINAGGVTFDNNYEIQGVGTPPATLSGTGTIIANGYLQMGSNIAASDPGLTFQIANNGNAWTVPTTLVPGVRRQRQCGLGRFPWRQWLSRAGGDPGW